MKKYLLVCLSILACILSASCNKDIISNDAVNNNWRTIDSYAPERNQSDAVHSTDDDTLNFDSDTIQNLLFGKWKISCLYAVLPSAFDFDRYASFADYDNLSDDPMIRDFVDPYDDKLLNELIEFSERSFKVGDLAKIQNPNYVLEKREGGVYNDNAWWRYRPFHDFFQFEANSYYYFEISDFEDGGGEFDILPKGFIVSYDYIVCPVHDDWIFYVLERQH